MSRYRAMFERLARHDEGAFGAFLMLGDPEFETSAALLEAVARGGADMLEVGIPFSDPVADGPVIQAAAGRALRSGTRVGDCFELLVAFRKHHAQIPVGILTYANLVVARGVDRFCADAAAAGVDSLLIADVPAIEAEPFARAAGAAGLDFVMIAAPNTPPATLDRIGQLASGYTYCVARAGVTGARDRLKLNHDELFRNLKGIGAPPPILGFGISTPDHVRLALDSGAAGVIAGSALVDLVQRGSAAPAAVSDLVRSMKQATLPG
jgi:tryptophan synthase alpha chain